MQLFCNFCFLPYTFEYVRIFHALHLYSISQRILSHIYASPCQNRESSGNMKHILRHSMFIKAIILEQNRCFFLIPDIKWTTLLTATAPIDGLTKPSIIIVVDFPAPLGQEFSYSRFILV